MVPQNGADTPFAYAASGMAFKSVTFIVSVLQAARHRAKAAMWAIRFIRLSVLVLKNRHF